MRPNLSLVLMWKPSHYSCPYWKKIYIQFKVDVTINVPRSAMASGSISFQGLGTVFSGPDARVILLAYVHRHKYGRADACSTQYQFCFYSSKTHKFLKISIMLTSMVFTGALLVASSLPSAMAATCYAMGVRSTNSAGFGLGGTTYSGGQGLVLYNENDEEIGSYDPGQFGSGVCSDFIAVPTDNLPLVFEWGASCEFQNFGYVEREIVSSFPVYFETNVLFTSASATALMATKPILKERNLKTEMTSMVWESRLAPSARSASNVSLDIDCRFSRASS